MPLVLAPQFIGERGKVDLTTGLTAVVDSTLAPYTPLSLNDDNLSTFWASNLTSGWSGNAFFAFDFGSAVELLSGSMYQNSSGYCTSVKVQYSDTGTSGPWTDAQTVSSLVGGLPPEEFSISPSGSHRYWRVLANDIVNGGGVYWTVHEIEFFK